MLNNQPVRINKWLLPLSWLYGLVVFFRNKLFKWGILKQVQYDIPVICVGNITVGGTGKTPHTEYLVNMLHRKFRIAVLSRGYKRKTKGFVLADANSTSRDIGDESYQIKQKYPSIIVAVDSDRKRGIETLLALDNPPQVIILDDAFQHRYVKPSFTVLLSNFYRPMYNDTLLPAGRLREPMSYMKKADVILITKCPKELKPIDYRIMTHDVKPYPYQELFFTSYDYCSLYKVFGMDCININYLNKKHILLVTGIASPNMIIDKLKEYTDKTDVMAFSDHHNFSKSDIKEIQSHFEAIMAKDKLILVTEKDAARLIERNDIDERIKDKIYSLPIEVSFTTKESESLFRQKILTHVREYSKNRSLYKN